RVAALLVASAALLRKMNARQLKRRILVVIEKKMATLPTGRRVTPIAGALELPRVRVFVASGAGNRVKLVAAVFVTLAALQSGVFAGQRESRGSVIEKKVPPVPPAFVVAVLAIHRELAVVRVFVASVASNRVELVAAVFVTFAALQSGVFAGQRKSRCGVIEGKVSPLPLTFVVTVLAIRRELAVVRVFVASVAGDRAELEPAVFMALAALQSGVFAGQRELRRGVIEEKIPPRPSAFDVTVLAIRRELAVVRVFVAFAARLR
ncbi:unnamed protein product, partial [marine sediment metagenome]